MSARDDWREIRIEQINPANGDRSVQRLGDFEDTITTGGRWRSGVRRSPGRSFKK